MTRPPASPSTARVFTTAISSAIWFLILYGTGWAFSGGGKVAHVSPLVIANLIAISFLFIPYFATEGTLLGMLEGVLKQRIIMPDGSQDANANATNPWRSGAINALLFGAVPAAIGYFLALRTEVDSLTPRGFGVRYALAGSLLCAAVTWYVGGKPFLHAASVPRGKPAFGGDPKPYLWSHFVLPHGIANALINGALAFALSPVPFAQAGAIVPTKTVVGDAVITFLILTFLIVSGTKRQARVEAQWGIAPRAAASDDSVPSAFMTAYFASLAFSIAVGVIFWLTKSPGLGVVSWAVFRGVAFGIYTAWLSKLTARAVINGVLNSAPSAETAKIAAE